MLGMSEIGLVRLHPTEAHENSGLSHSMDKQSMLPWRQTVKTQDGRYSFKLLTPESTMKVSALSAWPSLPGYLVDLDPPPFDCSQPL